MTHDIVSISLKPDAVGSQRIIAAAHKRGYTAKVISLKHTEIDKVVEEVDNATKAILRVSPSSYAICSQLTDGLRGVKQYEFRKVLDSFDKVKSMSVLVSTGLSIPKTQIVNNIDDITIALPFVVKVPIGNQGSGVFLAKTLPEVVALMEQSGPQLIIQEYIEEARASDKRLFVVKGSVIASMRRVGSPGDFRSNIHQGGKAFAYESTAQEKDCAIKAVEAHGLMFAGVDIIDSARGPLVLEVNPSPGFAISDIAGVDVAGILVQQLMKG